LLHLQGLDRRRFRPVLACPPVLIPALGQDIPSDVEVIPFDRRSPNRMGAAFRFCRILRQQRVDILHSHMFQASRLASPLARMCSVPLILETSHGRESWRKGWLKGSFVVDRLVGHTVDRMIAVSEANARYLVKDKGLPAGKITVIYPGVRFERFNPSAAVPLDLKTRLGFDVNDPVLLVAGRLEPQKGHRVLIDALPLILREFPRVRLVCLSDGALRSKLEQRVAELGLQNSVRFTGYQPDLLPWLALADICVLPSYYEGLPVAVVEALASGKPMVATAVDGTPEVLTDGETGLLVPPGDSASLAKAIIQMLANPEQRASMARKGHERVLELFGKDVMIERTQDFYLRSWHEKGHESPELIPVGGQAQMEECRK
ncbi:MAG TPA: glycosyltransferase family 4 protein, partial [Candidatus Acidoferrales bacterium]|nr:glycosyltransferase family 4 protein [Candidatus Acidoferrales bacterium]